MKTRFTLSALLTACIALSFVGTLAAQENKYPDAKPMFVAGPPHLNIAVRKSPAGPLSQWNGSFIDVTKKKITFTMVGTSPLTTNVSTTVPVFIIPIKLVFGKTNGNMSFDPSTHKLPNGKTVVQDIIASPIFNPGVNFTQGGTNVGTTQYIDAYQRANFWSTVGTKNKNYHVLLGTPTVLATQSIIVPASLGSVISNPFAAGKVGTYDINAFDANLQTIMKKFKQINSSVLPLFVTYDAFLTSGGCCIGGYHSANGVQPGGQTYSHASYVDQKGSFSQDVSALSHEIGEWMDDPFVDNLVNCQDNGIMENGDPLEGNSNYGAFPYALNGSTYNLQSLVFIDYFGDKRSTSLHNWFSFQHDEANFCPGQ